MITISIDFLNVISYYYARFFKVIPIEVNGINVILTGNNSEVQNEKS